ncbi:hypothetical protein [Saccharothrix deserti]|uniref:hypothetical protein n=1 Tax=Saccharothrix deserti TaxID=2593674 RepID=UPI00131E81B2|nr:hypothetical protein [Saccharothrix deserti]
MRMPFDVHATVRADFERRWFRAYPMMLVGFLAAPVVSVAGVALSDSGGLWGLGLLALGCAPPVWFVVERIYVHVAKSWGPMVVCSGAVQALAIAWLTHQAPPVVSTLVAAVLGALLVEWACSVLLDPTGGAIAATTLGIRSRERRVRGAAGWPRRAFAGFDGEWLYWCVGAGPSASHVVDGKLRLQEVDGVWVADATGLPTGPVVVVRTPDRQVQLVVGDPHHFAALLDRRVRLLGVSGWT